MLKSHRYQIPSNFLVAQLVSAIIISLGCVVLLGWYFDVEVIKAGFGVSQTTIKANEALCFVFAGASLWLVLQCENSRVFYYLGILCARFSIVVGGLTFSEYIFGWNLDIDQILFVDSSSTSLIHPGRMGLNAAVNFMLFGRALELLYEPKTPKNNWYNQILTILGGLISLQVIIGYFYQIDIAQGVILKQYLMSLDTAILFIVLCVGILLARSESAIMQLFTSNSDVGLLARKLLAGAVVIPLILGWLILQGYRARIYDVGFAMSLFAIAVMVMLGILIWRSAASIESLSEQRDISDRLCQRTQAALNANEQKLQSLVEANVIGISFGDVQGNITNANDELLKIIGYNREDLGSQLLSGQNLTPPEYHQLDLQKIAEAKENGACKAYEKEYIRQDGTRVPILIGYTLTGENRDESVAFILDLSERKKIEEALSSQQKWLEELLNLMPIPLLLIEPGTAKVTFANQAAEEIAGGKFAKNVPGEEYHTVYYCTDAQGNRIPDMETPGVRVAKGEKLTDFEMDWHTSKGIRSLLIHADTLPAMHGNPANCVFVFQDITKLKQVESSLSLGYKRLNLLFNTANNLLSNQEPVVLLESVLHQLSEQIGLDCYFNYLVDEKQQEMKLVSYSGVTEEEAKSIQAFQGNPQHLTNDLRLASDKLRRASFAYVQQSTDTNIQLLRDLGLEAYASFPLIVQGELLGILAFGSRKHCKFSENELGMMQAVCDQVAIAMQRNSLLSSLQRQTEQLREANRMKDEFLAILSHELRSPLNAIMGWAQLLRSRPQLDEAKKAQAIETIERNAKAQKQLIEDLLDISRIIRGKLRLNVSACDVIPIITSAIESVRIAAEAKEIKVQFYLDNQYSQVYITADAERLQQVIWNLLTNAIKFTPPGGNVEIKLTLQPTDSNTSNKSTVKIHVADTGMGIASEFLPYVFDRFRQADSSSTRSHGGLGLGLSIVRQLVELHGGTVAVTSLGEGQGATFTVQLPLLESKTIPNSLPTSSPQLTPASIFNTPSLTGICVLIVDDEADSRDFLVTVLQQCDAEVIAVASVAEALTAISQHHPQVLVSDIGMPGEDGYSLIRKIRKLSPGEGGKIPAAALTAYARPEDRVRAIREGFQLHLPKPIEPAELAAVVASLVGRT
ncbi:ATP-binding protein [Calothrix sp. PCC 6303]|uniref:PAS domain-containing hybrid sensor histidine kinase/response regulator n=1 Tax=Calothrix sp. PCC 6303 TaxID=1170562 RepID=UPI0002A03C40|nr:ATP-binding protein [Calothrix sp. PCC 6303]AFZ00295.1 multi-sensor hybrid histidine kinase [Calothrix sp. PCC 6303]